MTDSRIGCFFIGHRPQEPTAAEIVESARRLTEEQMHYRNGREAKNGDKIVKLGMDGGKLVAFGVLHSATPGNDYCNGSIAPLQAPNEGACMVDCLHVEDLEELIAKAGLDKRPPGR